MSLIPEAVYEQHIIILGKTRSGKSSVARGMVEHLLDKGKPVCIVDPKGDHWGLKSSADGKSAGYKVVIFGGTHGDVPLNARSGTAVAELAATENRPCIIDLGGWMPGERTQFWIDFASTFFRVSLGQRFLVIDEVHNFCPKGKVMDPNAGKMLHWSNRLASEGLGKGINLIAASQRPQKVHNDFLTSCETLIAMRVIHAADRAAFEDWIDGCGDPEKGPEVVETLAALKRGEAWVWSPEAEFGPTRIQFPLFSTYDSFKAQTAQHPAKLKGWADVDLVEVTKKLELVVKEAEANDPVKLKARIRELEAASRHLPGHSTQLAVADPKAIERAVASAVARVNQDKRTMLIAWKSNIAALERLAHGLRDLSERAAASIQTAGNVSIGIQPDNITDAPKESPPPRTAYTRGGYMALPEEIRRAESNGTKLRSGAERMLAAIAQWHPGGMSLGQMCSHAGLKKSGTFTAYMSDLRRGNYIEERNGEVYATDIGLEYCKHVPAAPSTTEEVLEIWNPKLRDGARRMLGILVEAGGDNVSREELGERAGLAKSGTFTAYLSDLRTARLVVVNRDGVAANKETLFL